MFKPPQCSVGESADKLSSIPGWKLLVDKTLFEWLIAMSGRIHISVVRPFDLRTKGRIATSGFNLKVYVGFKNVHEKSFFSSNVKGVIEEMREWMTTKAKEVELRMMRDEVAEALEEMP